MSRSRSVPFRAVEVHRPPSAPGRPQTSEVSGRLRFSDLLRARRTVPSASAPIAEAEAIDGPLPDGDPLLAPRLVPHPTALPAVDEDDAPKTDRVADEDDEETPEWAAGLVPTPAALQPLLPGGAARLNEASMHPLVASVGRTIARFCNERAVNESEGWQVRIPLRPEMLPATTLDLRVSPHWLQLRFETEDARSRDLVLRHRDALGRMLDEALQRRREIAITVD
jgi:type III secretion control protein HpaP